MKTCSKCGIPKELKEFNKSKNRGDGLQPYCKECKKRIDLNYTSQNRKLLREKANKRTKETREWYDELKKKLECLKCKDKRYYLIEFHHLDPKKKENTVTNLLWQKKKDKSYVLKEIKKCIPLCANCHREFHFLEKKEGIKIKEYLKD